MDALTQLREHIESQLHNHIDKIDPSAVVRTLTKRLADEQDKIIYAMLGLEPRFGRWELAAPRGNEHSPMQAYLRELVAPTLHEWMAKAVERLFEQEGTKARIDKLVTDYARDALNKLDYNTKKRVDTEIENYVTRNIAKILEDVLK